MQRLAMLERIEMTSTETGFLLLCMGVLKRSHILVVSYFLRGRGGGGDPEINSANHANFTKSPFCEQICTGKIVGKYIRCGYCYGHLSREAHQPANDT
jgi:hypothetical protein